MKITKEILESMGFQQQKNSFGYLIDQWYLIIKGYVFIVKGGPLYWEFSSPGSFVSSHPSSLEDILVQVYQDAYESGKKECKKEIREFLEIKDK